MDIELDDAIGVLIRYPPHYEYIKNGEPVITIEMAKTHIQQHGAVFWELPIIHRGVVVKHFPHAEEAKIAFFTKFPDRIVTHMGHIVASGRRDVFFDNKELEKYVIPEYRVIWKDPSDALRTYSFLIDKIIDLPKEYRIHIRNFIHSMAGKNVNHKDQLHRPRPVLIPPEFMELIDDV